jgi:hypothetical protein
MRIKFNDLRFHGTGNGLLALAHTEWGEVCEEAAGESIESAAIQSVGNAAPPIPDSFLLDAIPA